MLDSIPRGFEQGRLEPGRQMSWIFPLQILIYLNIQDISIYNQYGSKKQLYSGIIDIQNPVYI